MSAYTRSGWSLRTMARTVLHPPSTKAIPPRNRGPACALDNRAVFDSPRSHFTSDIVVSAGIGAPKRLTSGFANAMPGDTATTPIVVKALVACTHVSFVPTPAFAHPPRWELISAGL